MFAVRSPRLSALLAAALLLGLAGCGEEEDPRPKLAVTTSYLECAVRDLAAEEFHIIRMLPPGTCPGHFDVTPAMVSRLRECPLLLRFDFQEGLEEKLRRLEAHGLRSVAVPAGEGLCVPATYAETCRAVCGALGEVYPEREAAYRARLASIEARMEALREEAASAVRRAGLGGAPVVASGHQASFCAALGLRVLATYTGGDAQKLSRLQACIAEGHRAAVRLVVANLQEGPQLADPLAHRLGARAVVLSNFPSMEEGQRTFDELVRANVAALCDGCLP
ncbi:MAG: metal ABC transporter substrate-binding protein [Candidatus Brocadiia bacterium]